MSLLSALYTGVSGLQTFGESLQVIGDNIANVNTTAFKANRAEFADLLSQTINGGSGRSQMGRGVSLDRISANFSQGSFSNTDRLTDIAINGNGFFVVNDGARDYYTRNGQLTLNNNGELVTTKGYKLMGYEYDSTGNALGTLGAMSIMQRTTQPHQTGDGTAGNTGVTMNINLSSTAATSTFDINDPSGTSYNHAAVTVYDSYGAPHKLEVYFNKTANNNWQWHAVANGSEVQPSTTGYVEGASGTLGFDTTGNLQTATTTSSSFNFTGTPMTIGFNWGNPIATGGDGSGTTQFSNEWKISTTTQDGYGAGDLDSVAIDENGIISGNYSNGQTIPVGQVALANFANLQGLFKAGSSIYGDTTESGVPIIGKPNQGGMGTISAYSLELSNVDLATEFVALISNQRAYQANSKIITVGDELLSDVVNIIR